MHKRVGAVAPAALAKTLLDKYEVWTVAIDTANVHGMRITQWPGVAPTTAQFDRPFHSEPHS